MKYKLFFTWDNGYKDYLIIEADTIKELREIGRREKEKRNPDCYWSEKL